MTSVLRRKYHMYVPRETVRTVLKQLDPVSVSLRRRHRLTRRTYWSRGPNHTWHVDGYDKLIQYGFSISGLVTVILLLSTSTCRGKCTAYYNASHIQFLTLCSSKIN